MSEFRRRLMLNYTTPLEGGHNLGDIAYWNGSAIAFSPSSSWTSSLGTPLAVCCIPTSHNVYGNGKAGFISIHPIDSAGTATSADTGMEWGPVEDAGLTKYAAVPTWTNDSGSSYETNEYGYLPSDSSTFTGDTCFCDSQARYNKTGRTYMTPSCYLNDGSQNTAYTQTLTDGNALSDFAGAANTAVLAAKGSGYTAAYACSHYSTDGIPAGSWYLPAAGELGYIVPRFAAINNAITVCGGVVLGAAYFWSSSEFSANYAYRVYTISGYVVDGNKGSTRCVRAFAALA